LRKRFGIAETIVYIIDLFESEHKVFFDGKFCYQFYFVMKMENLITIPQAKMLLNGTSAPRGYPCPG
jgi:hypothetical protein